MIDSLTNRLIDMKNELLALKTAHKHGLGTLRLWEYDKAPSSGSGVLMAITATIANDMPSFPLIEASINNDNSSLKRANVSSDGRVYTWAFYAASGDVAHITSTTELDTLIVEWTDE